MNEQDLNMLMMLMDTKLDKESALFTALRLAEVWPDAVMQIAKKGRCRCLDLLAFNGLGHQSLATAAQSCFFTVLTAKDSNQYFNSI
jgi:hypothetical protein